METVEWMAPKVVHILSKQHQMERKVFAVNPQTSYGPEDRGFESLIAHQNCGNSLNFHSFLLLSALFRVVQFCGIGLPQAVTHTRARSENHRRVPERKFPTAFAACFCMEVVT